MTLRELPPRRQVHSYHIPVAVVLLIVAAVCAGQPASFEVASVKKSVIATDHPQGFIIPSTAIRGLTGDRLREPHTTLAELIMQAYEVKDYQISGLPAWGGTMGEQFDVEAKAGAAPAPGQVRVMLQGLLAERFGLKVHRAAKELAVYELSGGSGGPRMKEVDGPLAPGDRRQNSGPIRMPIETLASMLAMHLDRPVVDRTGLTGKSYEFQFDLVALARCGQEPDAVNCVSGVAEAVGLKLSARKGTAELMVVDRVERPTGN